jgi:hypothetical protein
MKTIKKQWLALAGLLGVGGVLVGIVLTATAQSVPPPVITIALTNTNELVITVTNGVSYGYYSLYNQHVLDGSPWALVSTNEALGVTNFLVNTIPYFEGYYYVAASTNWNDDGIPNWDLADPNNPGLGKLTVTIVSPSQGQILQ